MFVFVVFAARASARGVRSYSSTSSYSSTYSYSSASTAVDRLLLLLTARVDAGLAYCRRAGGAAVLFAKCYP